MIDLLLKVLGLFCMFLAVVCGALSILLVCFEGVEYGFVASGVLGAIGYMLMTS